jgi:hypothetical protein
MTSRTASATVELVARGSGMRSWNTAVQTPPTVFYPRAGLLPGVVGVRHQPPTWDVLGHSRTLDLSDGGSVVETITRSEPGSAFAYDLTAFRGVFGMLVADARAEWSFEARGSRCSIRWTYTFRARPGRGWIVRAVVASLWRPYMRRVLRVIVAAIDARRTF